MSDPTAIHRDALTKMDRSIPPSPTAMGNLPRNKVTGQTRSTSGIQCRRTLRVCLPSTNYGNFYTADRIQHQPAAYGISEQLLNRVGSRWQLRF